MFVQVIKGKVGDEAGLRAAMDRWLSDCQPGAAGWLGSTAGFADDGTFIVVARFESEDAARRNSERPEQGTWWAETAKCFAGDVSFGDFTDVSTWLAGGSDDAGFVQIIEGHFKDAARMRAMMEEHGDDLRRSRPEIIGATVASREDGTYVQAVYFTSEAEARAHESMPPPPDVAEMMSEEMQDATFLDLHQPLLTSPS